MDKLDKAVAAARKARMSYGKYMELKAEKEQPREAAPSKWGFGCAWCGKHFYPRRITAKYCCTYCKEEAGKQRKRERRMHE